MKKSRQFWPRRLWLATIMTAMALLLLTGCNDPAERVASVSLKEHDPSRVIEMAAGDFDYSPYTVVVTYDSGRTEELPLTADMIPEVDQFKFYQVGEHDITVTYAKQSCVFKVAVQRATLGHLTLPENNVFTYDGKPHTVEVQGHMPANAVVTYPSGNSFTNAGTYNVTAIVTCEGYASVRLSTTVKIERARYDMSGVKFEAAEFVYDGEPHAVAISGTLPEGVAQPTYIFNEKTASGVTDAGEYTVIARFENGNANYEPIPDMTTTLTIKQAEYAVSGLDLVFKNKEGVVLSDRQMVYNGTDVTFDLSDYEKLPRHAAVSFSVYDEGGNLIAGSNKVTEIRNAGVYTVKAEFTLADGKNYLPIDPIVREFEVTKADYPPLQNVYFDAAAFVYSGEAHSLQIEGELPEGMTVAYEYYLNDTLLVDGEGLPVQAVSDAGRYTVKAVFTHGDSNRKDVEPLSAVLQIDRAELDVAGLTFVLNGSSTYDGTPKSLVPEGTIPEGIVIHYEYYLDGQLLLEEDGVTPADSVIHAGDYVARILFESANSNYTSSGLREIEFSILPAEAPLSGAAMEGANSSMQEKTFIITRQESGVSGVALSGVSTVSYD